ncbi:MAG: carbohydrate porin [Planctomycetales bacterium]
MMFRSLQPVFACVFLLCICGRAAAEPDSTAISGNPAATNITVGSGWLGDYLGINRNGWRFAGLNITDINAQLTGGVQPGQWTVNNLTVFDLSIDTEKYLGWEGGLFGTEFLFYSGGATNHNAGTVMGYSSLDAGPPRTRQQIYQLWYRQQLFNKKLTVRVGKSTPTYDFNNVVRSVPFNDPEYNIPSLSSAILTPLFISPMLCGILPGYYDSATGLVASLTPNKNFYIQYGMFDGNKAAGRHTGLEGPHFNGYYLHLVEAGSNWTVGSEQKPGKFGIGYWKQTGLLERDGITVRGADGMYLFGSQRLYYERPGQSDDGISVYFQFGASDSAVISTHRYIGCGITFFGPLPCRDDDSAGFAFAYGSMNPDPTLDLGPRELIYSWYYQYRVNPNCFLQPNISYIGQPAAEPGLSDVFALTMRAILLF